MSTAEISPADYAPTARTQTPNPTQKRPLSSRSEQLGRGAARRRTPVGSEPAPDWRLSAACVERDLNIFFPISSVGAAVQRQINEAKAICASCPVQPQCLDWALEVGPEFGIFGGRTEEERRALRMESGRTSRWRNSPIVRIARSEESVTEALEPR